MNPLTRLLRRLRRYLPHIGRFREISRPRFEADPELEIRQLVASRVKREIKPDRVLPENVTDIRERLR